MSMMESKLAEAIRLMLNSSTTAEEEHATDVQMEVLSEYDARPANMAVAMDAFRDEAIESEMAEAALAEYDARLAEDDHMLDEPTMETTRRIIEDEAKRVTAAIKASLAEDDVLRRGSEVTQEMVLVAANAYRDSSLGPYQTTGTFIPQHIRAALEAVMPIGQKSSADTNQLTIERDNLQARLEVMRERKDKAEAELAALNNAINEEESHARTYKSVYRKIRSRAADSLSLHGTAGESVDRAK